MFVIGAPSDVDYTALRVFVGDIRQAAGRCPHTSQLKARLLGYISVSCGILASPGLY